LDNFNDPESLADKDRKLADKDRELQALKQKLVEREKDFSPATRFLMTGAAQILGFILLISLGMFAFSPTEDKDIMRGLDFIRHSLIYYLIISLAIPLLVGIHIYYRQELRHRQVDIILLLYVFFDLVILLFLVHQQGGLCRSMFLPVFFLIPTAYMIVERREHKFRWRRLVVLGAIVLCICRSYLVSRGLMPPSGVVAGQPVEGIVHFLWWSGQSTDFPIRAHHDYDTALFCASLISASVPIVQMVIIKVQERLNRGESSIRPLFEDYR